MQASLVVQKFGSSVLSDRDRLPAVVHDVYRAHRRGHRVLVVVSAIGRHTDLLLAEAHRLADPAAPPGALAQLVARGEAGQCRLVKDVDGIYECDPAAAGADQRPHRYHEMAR